MTAAPSTFLTKGDANRWLAAAEADRFRGVWLDPKESRVVLEDYCWTWLASKVAIAPRTQEIYASQLRLHVLPAISPKVPALGHMELGALTPELIRAWYATLRLTRSPSVASKAYVRLRQILGQAVDDERIAKNPCRIKGGGTEDHPEQLCLNLPQLYRLASCVPPRYRAFVMLAGLAGLRRGELFALRRSDLELDKATVAVRRKRLRLSSGVVIEGPPKSRAGRRDVALPALLVTELAAHLDRFVEGTGPDSFVFSTAEGLPMEASNFRSRVWLPAVAAAELEGLRLHDLRHTAGTLAAQTGATTKELMARLGHASPQAAMLYQHASADRDRAIADGLSLMAAAAGLIDRPSNE